MADLKEREFRRLLNQAELPIQPELRWKLQEASGLSGIPERLDLFVAAYKFALGLVSLARLNEFEAAYEKARVGQ